jgi:hypothetical protein
VEATVALTRRIRRTIPGQGLLRASTRRPNDGEQPSVPRGRVPCLSIESPALTLTYPTPFTLISALPTTCLRTDETESHGTVSDVPHDNRLARATPHPSSSVSHRRVFTLSLDTPSCRRDHNLRGDKPHSTAQHSECERQACSHCSPLVTHAHARSRWCVQRIAHAAEHASFQSTDR